MIKIAEFQCILPQNNKNNTEMSNGTITILKDYTYHYDLLIKMISPIRLIYGETTSGFFVCFPDFYIGCNMANVYDRTSNKKQLVHILGEKDGTIVEAALFSIASTLVF